jgi:transcriptional regulator GlxA family with amidase domain
LLEQRVVDDDVIVTVGGVAAGIDLALHIVGRVDGRTYKQAASRFIEQETPAQVA